VDKQTELNQAAGVSQSASSKLLGILPSTANMEELNLGMSNFDGRIDEGLAELLQARPGEVFGRHAGWDFNGQVFFFDGRFHEEVWVYGSPRSTISADTLPDLMKVVCDEYGYE